VTSAEAADIGEGRTLTNSPGSGPGCMLSTLHPPSFDTRWAQKTPTRSGSRSASLTLFLPFTEGAFDFVTAFMSLINIPDQAQACPREKAERYNRALWPTPRGYERARERQ